MAAVRRKDRGISVSLSHHHMTNHASVVWNVQRLSPVGTPCVCDLPPSPCVLTLFSRLCLAYIHCIERTTTTAKQKRDARTSHRLHPFTSLFFCSTTTARLHLIRIRCALFGFGTACVTRCWHVAGIWSRKTERKNAYIFAPPKDDKKNEARNNRKDRGGQTKKHAETNPSEGGFCIRLALRAYFPPPLLLLLSVHPLQPVPVATRVRPNRNGGFGKCILKFTACLAAFPVVPSCG